MIDVGNIPKHRWEVCNMKKPWGFPMVSFFHCLSEYNDYFTPRDPERNLVPLH